LAFKQKIKNNAKINKEETLTELRIKIAGLEKLINQRDSTIQEYEKIMKKGGGYICKSTEILEVAEEEENKKEEPKQDSQHNKSMSNDKGLRALMEEETKEQNEKMINTLEEKIHELEKANYKMKEEYDLRINKLKQKHFEKKSALKDCEIGKVIKL
jgi:hypothetical protein